MSRFLTFLAPGYSYETCESSFDHSHFSALRIVSKFQLFMKILNSRQDILFLKQLEQWFSDGLDNISKIVEGTKSASDMYSPPNTVLTLI